MNRWISLVIAGLAVGTFAWAQNPTTGPSDIDSLIARLSDASSDARDTAQNALADLGESAIPAMKAAREVATDPDVQLRLDALIVRTAEASAVGASRITLKFNNAPLKEVLDELSRQSRATFSDPNQDFGNEPPKITVDVSDVSFWQALAALRANNISFLPQQDLWRLTRNMGNPMFNAAGAEAGAFLIQPMNASYSRSVSYSPNISSGENFMISFQVMSEPKIRLAQTAGQFRVTRAVDSNGNNLAASGGTQSFGVGQNVFHISAQLAYPKQPGEKIAELTGLLKLNIARNIESLTIEDFGPSSKPLQKTLDNARIRIAPAEVNPAQPNWVNMTVSIESTGDPSAYNRMQQAIRQIRVLDGNGRPMQMTQFQPSTVNPQRGDFNLSFMPIGNAPNPGTSKVSLDIPTSFREVEVPFTLRDLRMP